ncbi:MAG: FAD-binding oxidoreductase, partial [Candidatus Dormibacteraeota bacterium]|nr:FAD-binding oxidoreductase [Candidatus Dormibacteraeota bacterium]
MADLLSDLQGIVGTPHVITGEASRDFTHDATFLTHDLLCVVRPAATDEVARVVRACAAAGTPVVARGSGTSL